MRNYWDFKDYQQNRQIESRIRNKYAGAISESYEYHDNFSRFRFDRGKAKNAPQFRKMNWDDYSAQELLDLIVHKKKVLLEVNLNLDYSSHRLFSYAAAGYGLENYAKYAAGFAGEKGMAMFETKFCLCREELDKEIYWPHTSDGFCFEEENVCLVPTVSLSETEELFASESTWMDYCSGELYLFSDESDFITRKLSELKECPEKTELYLSDYYGNNQGDLSCVFEEWWLQNHREYLLGVYNPFLAEEVGDFWVSGNQTIVGVSAYIRRTETYVEIPGNIKRIGEKAFAECENLIAIAIPESVTEIGAGAFYGCESLEIIKIPSAVKTIERETFAHCTSLREVILPDSLKSIQSHAFYHCRFMEPIPAAPNIHVEENAFELCSWEDRIIALLFPEYVSAETISRTLSMLKKVLPSGYHFKAFTVYSGWDMKDAYYESDIQLLVIDASLFVYEEEEEEEEEEEGMEDTNNAYRDLCDLIIEMFGTYRAPAFLIENYEKYCSEYTWDRRSFLENFVPEIAVNEGLDEEIDEELYDVVFFSLETGAAFKEFYLNKTQDAGELIKLLKDFRRGFKERYDKLFALDPEKAPKEYLDYFFGE